MPSHNSRKRKAAVANSRRKNTASRKRGKKPISEPDEQLAEGKFDFIMSEPFSCMPPTQLIKGEPLIIDDRQVIMTTIKREIEEVDERPFVPKPKLLFVPPIIEEVKVEPCDPVAYTRPKRTAKKRYASLKENIFCTCEVKKRRSMIACDNVICPFEWYHLACIGMRPKDIPDGAWECRLCRER